ncbi:MAG: sulfotransferase domain-containing protein [Candidatus Aminicenantaceae bacterium]
MKLDEYTNYIVSGIERSGTSMLMQILNAGGIPVAFDHSSRPPDDNNPKGYYELEGGKIINRLMEGTFRFARYRGKFIKVTAYGLKYLSPGKYKVIYTERDIEEVLDSMEKMARMQDENREDTRNSFVKLNELIKETISKRSDIEVLLVNYNDILSHPRENIRKICGFIGSSESDIDFDKMINSIDEKLYRNRRS